MSDEDVHKPKAFWQGPKERFRAECSFVEGCVYRAYAKTPETAAEHMMEHIEYVHKLMIEPIVLLNPPTQ